MNRAKIVLSTLAAALLSAAAARAQMEVMSSGELREKAAREAEPVLEVSPRSLEATVAPGERAQFRLKISNAGGRELRWRLRSELAGTFFSATEGALGHRDSELVDVSVRVAGAPGGTVRGEVIVEAAGVPGSPARVAVSVHARGPKTEEAAKVEEPERPPVPTPRETAALKGFGVHVGFAAPLAGGEEGYLGGLAAGVHYRPAREGTPLGFEFGLDVISSSSGGGATSSLVMAGAAALYHPAESRPFYVLGGGRIVGEWVSVDSPDAGGVGASLDVGGGVTFADGRMDVRATFSFLVGSRNVPGFGGVAVGYSF